MPEVSPYAYAKACGIIGKSFVGKHISSLAGIRSLNELNRFVFPGHYRELPGKELLHDFEKRIIERAVFQILEIISSYAKPPELIVRMLQSYEYSDLKSCIQNIAAADSAGKKAELPYICNIGIFKTVNFTVFPDIGAMIKDTEFASVLSEDLNSLKNGDTTVLETKLDIIYYNNRIKCIKKLSNEDRLFIQRFFAAEISLRNCQCALRMRSYFNKSDIEIKNYLMDISIQGNRTSLAEDALKTLDFPLDMRNFWEGWKWEKLINQEEASVHWKVDPRYFQNAASRYMYLLAWRGFHRYPLSVTSIFCFIKLKQFEEDLLTSIAEGLSLGMSSSDVFELLETLP
jgi:vacuolar-type H+-ATPase subunit C/Vma6